MNDEDDNRETPASLDAPTLSPNLLVNHPAAVTNEAKTLALPSPHDQAQSPIESARLDASASLPPGTADTGNQFGDYELIHEIARGGMGVVYKARQISLNRTVALKMILSGAIASREDVERFFVEAEAAAKLDHPSIVPVYDIGEWQGRHFFSMGYIEGGSLADVLRNGPIPAAIAAPFMVQVADAIQYAHDQGVIHRDLKPGNILLQKSIRTRPFADSSSLALLQKPQTLGGSEFRIDDVLPKVSDFGLAKHVHRDSDLTSTGQILGTPSYMSPEQANALNDDVGPATDVYALGAILYCMLCGHPPFQSTSPMDTLLQVIGQEPISLRILNSSIPRDLETICMKCLQKSPAKRYASAKELAEDLHRFCDGEHILARPPNTVERFERWCHKHPTIAVLSVSLFVVLVAGIVISSLYAAEARLQAYHSLVAEREARTERDLAIRYLSQTNFALANDLFHSFRCRDAVAKLERIPAEHRSLEWHFARNEFQHDSRTIQNASTGSMTIAVNPVHPDVAAFTTDGWLRVWDRNSGQLKKELSYKTELQGDYSPMAYSSDGSRLIVRNPSRLTLDIYDTTSYASVSQSMAFSDVIRCISPHPARPELAIGLRNGQAIIWNFDTNSMEHSWPAHTKGFTDIAYSPDQKSIATTVDTSLRLWNAETRSIEHELHSDHGRIRSLRWSDDSARIVTAALDHAVLVWNVALGGIESHLNFNSSVIDASIDSNRKLVAAALGDHSIQLWSYDREITPSLRIGHSNIVGAVHFDQSGSRLLSASSDGTIRFWNTLIPEVAYEQCFGIANDSDLVSIANGEGIVRVYRASTGQQIWQRSIHSTGVTASAFAPSEQELIIASANGEIVVSNAINGEPKSTLPKMDSRIDCMAWDSKRDAWVMAVSRPGGTSLQLIDRKTHKVLAETMCEHGSALSLCPLPSRESYAIGFGDVTTVIWDARNGTMSELDGHENGITGLATMNDERCLVVSDGDKAIVWDLDAKQVIQQFSANGSFFHLVAVSPDNSRIVSGNLDGNVKFWDAKTGEEVWSLPRLSGAIMSFQFSSDGESLAIVTANGEVERLQRYHESPANP